MTIRDVDLLSYPELEKLMDGLNKNADEERKMYENGGSAKKGNAEDLLSALGGTGGF